MPEQFVQSGPLELWTESFGNHKNPAILLIMGAGTQAIFWPDRLCQFLADSGFFVIRYDNRDTGKSSSVDFSKNPYTLNDIAKDAIVILDAYNIDNATIVGASMGGYIAQLAALAYPERVSNLVIIMATSDFSVIIRALIPFVLRPLFRLFLGVGFKRTNLPPPTNEVIAFFRSQILFPLRKRKARVKIGVMAWRIFSAGGLFDEKEMRALEEYAFSRSRNQNAFLNHAKAIIKSAKNRINIEAIARPTLIIHGQRDPVFPVEHGVAIAQKIPGARLEIIPEMGHILPQKLSATLALLIIDHLKQHSTN